jgi:hypothetical protein
VKTIKFLLSAFFALMIGTAAQAQLGLNAFAVAGTIIAGGAALPYVIKDLPAGLALMAVSTDVSALQGWITKYDTTKINQALNGMDIARDLTVIRNLREPMALPKMTVDAGGRRLNTSIKEAKGGREWTERIITPYGAMKIISIIPEEVRDSFMSSMLDINAKELPFAQWVWEQEFAKIASEINDNFYYSTRPTVVNFASGATYAANAHVLFENVVYKNISGSTTTAGESPLSASVKWKDVDNQVIIDGPDAIIKAEIAASNLAAVATGTFSETTAYGYFKDMWTDVPEAVKNKGLIAYVSHGVAEDLAENVNTKFGSGVGIGGVDIEEGVPFYLKNTNRRLKVMPCTWMGTSRRVIMAPSNNLVLGLNQVSDASKVGKMVDTLHGFDAIVKWMIGFQFRNLEELYVNDQA